MRDIIFRGKSKRTSEWVEGSLVQGVARYDKEPVFFIYSLETEIDGRGSIDNYYGDAVESETLGQFTGLLDKNGNKIFEGDIVKTEFGRLCIFEWFENRVTRCWDLSPILTNSNLIHPAPYRTSIFDSEHLEVVGNIHDNPELMEESK